MKFSIFRFIIIFALLVSTAIAEKTVIIKPVIKSEGIFPEQGRIYLVARYFSLNGEFLSVKKEVLAQRGSDGILGNIETPEVSQGFYSFGCAVCRQITVIEIKIPTVDGCYVFDHVEYWSTNNILLATNRVCIGFKGRTGPEGVDGK